MKYSLLLNNAMIVGTFILSGVCIGVKVSEKFAEWTMQSIERGVSYIYKAIWKPESGA